MTVSRSMGVKWADGRSSVWFPELGCSGSLSILEGRRVTVSLGVWGLFRASGLLGLDTAENVLPEKGLLLSNHEK
jgi:hypothetical protein